MLLPHADLLKSMNCLSIYKVVYLYRSKFVFLHVCGHLYIFPLVAVLWPNLWWSYQTKIKRKLWKNSKSWLQIQQVGSELTYFFFLKISLMEAVSFWKWCHWYLVLIFIFKRDNRVLNFDKLCLSRFLMSQWSQIISVSSLYLVVTRVKAHTN